MSVVDFRNDPRISKDDRETLRDHCRELNDPLSLAKKLGVKVFCEPLPDGLSGHLIYDESRGSRSGFVIVVNSNHPVGRQQFTIAHELGHFVLHRNTPQFRHAVRSSKEGKVIPFPGANRQALNFEGVDLPRGQEREADIFAVAVLLPPGATRRAPEYQMGQPCALARRLRLSTTMVVRRFEELSFGETF
ncbi:ImmA/IrrE family metallo-endopeptidase [Rhodobaculum claviforme]|uniref:IrrE N-terminal-like domain-containing protein n=1 Tax=Rhodobaculum claviforme TaxID=1549854 RepID=A0A934TKB2_9RHOB|nr:hypothetical protein [Rhodobaculum claviforme]